MKLCVFFPSPSHVCHTLRLLLLGLVALASSTPGAWAKAAYADADLMIERAEAIAIVTITQVEDVLTKADPFDFRQIAQASVEQTFKGTLPPTVKLYGEETFICAHVHFTPGRFLVFLQRQGGLLSACNWHLAVRPIQGSEVEWYAPGQVLESTWQPLDFILKKHLHTPPGQQ